MASVKVREIEIGNGIPKVCVPIAEKTQREIIEAAQAIVVSTADLVEWRVDWYEDVFDFDKVLETLEMIRKILEDRPLIFTCRTSQEGGELTLTEMQYKMLNQMAIESEMIDLVDVEMIHLASCGEQIVSAAHENKVKVIGSNHDFLATPSKDEIIKRLCEMQALEADIVNMAVMPKNTQDVLTLLQATECMVREYGSTPVITMSMGPRGVISRVSGSLFGSAVTFATVGKASAPGQMEIEDLRKAMKMLR